MTLELCADIDGPRFGRLVAAFVRSHTRWIGVGCPCRRAAPGKDCASTHQEGLGLRYPVRPHRERRNLAAEPRPWRRRR